MAFGRSCTEGSIYVAAVRESTVSSTSSGLAARPSGASDLWVFTNISWEVAKLALQSCDPTPAEVLTAPSASKRRSKKNRAPSCRSLSVWIQIPNYMRVVVQILLNVLRTQNRRHQSRFGLWGITARREPWQSESASIHTWGFYSANPASGLTDFLINFAAAWEVCSRKTASTTSCSLRRALHVGLGDISMGWGTMT